MKRIARSAYNLYIIVFLVAAVSVTCHDLRASEREVHEDEKNAEQDGLQQAIARRDRLRSELSRLIASTRSEETCRGRSPSQLASAAKRIRRLGYNLQESKTQVSSLELERARAVNRIAPGAVSQEELCRLDAQNQIDNLLLEQKRLETETECPRERSRLAEVKVSSAELRLNIANANLHEASRFPPGTISESEFRRLQSEVSVAKRRLDDARSDDLVSPNMNCLSLKGTRWTLKQFIRREDETEVKVGALKDCSIEIRFDETSARGSGGCNRFNCRIQFRDGGRLTVSDLKFALKLCGANVDQQEERFFRILSKTTRYSIEGTTLTLSDEKRLVSLRFSGSEAPTQ
jgi:heat shock protein HslJ